jgi:hypothetical protein
MSLLEVSIGMAITAIIMLMGFRFIQGMLQTGNAINGSSTYTQTFSLAYDYLERDISALRVPGQTWESLIKDQKKTPEASAGAAGVVGTPKKESALENSGDKKILIPCASGQDSKGNWYWLFVTTNRLPQYGIYRPYNGLVCYRLVPSENNTKYKCLVRGETPELDMPLEKFLGKIRFSVVIDMITQLSVTFFAPKQEEKKEKAGERQPGQLEPPKPPESTKPKEPKKPLEFEQYEDSWDFKKMREKKVLIPAYVVFEGEWFDLYTQHEQPFEFWFKIASFDEHVLAWKEKREQSKQDVSKTLPAVQEQQMPGAPAAPGASPAGATQSGRPKLPFGGKPPVRGLLGGAPIAHPVPIHQAPPPQRPKAIVLDVRGGVQVPAPGMSSRPGSPFSFGGVLG